MSTSTIANPSDALPDAPDPRWIQTFTGRAFFPLNPCATNVCIEDIAHALAMKCRFTGHCRHFYSVAQHSVAITYIVPPEDRLWALLHDAGEAYLPDVARPIKKYLEGFDAIEDAVMEAVCFRFGLEPDPPASISAADLRLLAAEARDLLAPSPYHWRSIEGIEPLPMMIFPLGPEAAEREFLARFRNLTEGK